MGLVSMCHKSSHCQPYSWLGVGVLSVGVLSVGVGVSLASAAEASADGASTAMSSPSAVSPEAADGRARSGTATRATRVNPGVASAVAERARPASVRAPRGWLPRVFDA